MNNKKLKMNLNIKTFTLCYFNLFLIHKMYLLYVLDLRLECQYNTNLFLFNQIIDTKLLSIYFSFNINTLSLIFVILNNVVIILCLL